jgi:hypothetical glycosyl hydrolase
MPLQFDLGKDEYKDWIISLTEFHSHFISKFESTMSLGNGYMGLRAAAEEQYLGETRNLFIAGTFNKFSEKETTELPNAADITRLTITINGNVFSLKKGTHREFRQELNLKDGELTRSLIWQSPKGQEFHIVFRRFVSMDNLHLIGIKVEITPINTTADVSIISGINGQITNSGSQHFEDRKKRIHDKKFIELNQSTTESHIDFVFFCHNKMYTESDNNAVSIITSDKRNITQKLFSKVHKFETLTFEKKVLIYTTRDKEYSSQDPDYNGQYSSRNLRLSTLFKMRKHALSQMKALETKGYDDLLEKSINKWRQLWNTIDIQIDTKDNFDQLAIRFALYHMIIMTPAHDSRFSIGNKGLSGEKYRGHTFWDTEIFILPMFMYIIPGTAKTLLEYRYNSINSARKKAEKKGYQGAMYPWESAWINHGEATPFWGSVDINTGKNTLITSGFIEQHISADISYAVWQYYMITQDQDFMDKCGYEIIFETATFWTSRSEWNSSTELFEIKDIMGPDEYKIHINNNAYTNYMAHWNIQKAIEYCNIIKNEKIEIFKKLDTAINLQKKFEKWNEVIDKIYLPMPGEHDLVIPQDDSYLNKKQINLSKYREQSQTRIIFQDYNLEQISQLQITKQADVLMLFYLLENKFSDEVKRANWKFYEPRTLHDSSLSYSVHSILAADLVSVKEAYSFFKKASRIDFGLNMTSSNEGIHAGAMGGIWQNVVCGFGGVKMLNGKLSINPKLPEKWNKLNYAIHWHGDRLEVAVMKNKLIITRNEQFNSNPIDLTVNGKEYSLETTLKIPLKQKDTLKK